MRRFILGWARETSMALIIFATICCGITAYLLVTCGKMRDVGNVAGWYRYHTAYQFMSDVAIASSVMAATASLAYHYQLKQANAEFDDQLWEHTAEVNPEELALFPEHPADAMVAKFLDTREHEGAWAVQVETEDKKKWWFRVDAKTRHRFIVPGTYVVIQKNAVLVTDPGEA